MSSGARSLSILAALLLGVALLLWSPFPGGLWHDDGVYLLLGRALEAGEGLRYLGVAGDPPAGKFPPLYPLVLAGLWGLVGDVDGVTAAASLLNFGFVAGAALLFWRLLVRHLEVSPGVAAAVTAIPWLSLPLWGVALLPFSEPLYLLLSVGAITLACRAEEGAAGPRATLLLALVLLATVYSRTVGVALALAVAAGLALRGRGRSAAGVAVAVAAGIAPWVVWSRSAGAALPESLRDVLGPYGPWLLGQVAEAPGWYLRVMEGQAQYIVQSVLGFFFPSPAAWAGWFPVLRWVGLLVLVPAFVLGLDRVWKHRRTPVLYLFAYLALIWTWPFRDVRLLVPILPFLFLVVLEGFRLGRGDGPEAGEGADDEGSGDERPGGDGSDGGEGRPTAGRGRGTRPIPPSWIRTWRGIGVGWAVIFVILTVIGVWEGRPGEAYRIQAPALARAVQAVQEATPAEAVIGAPEFWAALHLHAGRRVVPSARFLPVRPPSEGPVWGTVEEQLRLWDAADVDYLVLERNGGIHGEALDAIVERCGADAVQLAASWQGGRLAHLAWSADCRRRLLEDRLPGP